MNPHPVGQGRPADVMDDSASSSLVSQGAQAHLCGQDGGTFLLERQHPEKHDSFRKHSWNYRGRAALQ